MTFRSKMTLWRGLCLPSSRKGLDFGTLAVVSSIYSTFLPPIQGAPIRLLLPKKNFEVGYARAYRHEVPVYALTRIEN